MARHNLFVGGPVRDNTQGYNMGAGVFPGTPYAPNQEVALDSRGTNNSSFVATCLYFGESGCDPDICLGCNEDGTSQSNGAKGYHVGNYMVQMAARGEAFAVGDVIPVQQLPKGKTLERIKFEIFAPITPFTFDIQVSGYDQNSATPGAPIVLATNVSGSAKMWDILDVKAIADSISGNPAIGPSGIFKMLTNGFLEIVIKTMPPVGAPGSCGGCSTCGGLTGLGISMGALLQGYDDGCLF